MTAQKYLYECSPSLAEKLNNHLLRRMVEEVMQEYAEHYHAEKLKEILPSEEEIKKEANNMPHNISDVGFALGEESEFGLGAHFVKNFVINKLKQ